MRGGAAPGRLRHRVGATIARRALWQPGDRVAVAVSGGLDSMCLLALLVDTASWHRARLEVVTIDHGQHSDSAAHATFVQARCAVLELPCTTEVLSLGSPASEADARAARYGALDRLAVDRVALAHHRDDLAETVLLHLVRGTGTRGLAGMGWHRDRYVRPLLDVSRDALRGYADAAGLRWVEDPTNASDGPLRNRLRSRVLPLLEQLRPGAAAAIARGAALAAQDADLLDALLSDLPEAEPGPAGWPTAWLAEAPPALVGRALHRRLPGLAATHVAEIVACARRGTGRVALPGGREVVVARGRACVVAAVGGVAGDDEAVI